MTSSQTQTYRQTKPDKYTHRMDSAENVVKLALIIIPPYSAVWLHEFQHRSSVLCTRERHSVGYRVSFTLIPYMLICPPGHWLPMAASHWGQITPTEKLPTKRANVPGMEMGINNGKAVPRILTQVSGHPDHQWREHRK
jgi:hypothetical protein